MPIFCKFNQDTIKLSNHPISSNNFFDLSSTSIIADFLNLFLHEKEIFLPDRYNEMFSQLGCQDPKFEYLPSETTKKILQKFALISEKIFSCQKNVDYCNVFLDIDKFLNSLETPFVNSNILKNRIANAEYDGVANNYKTFNASKTGKSSKIIYSQTSTLTGRLTVKSGPKILTSPSNVRTCFLPKTKKGKIIQIDLISAEPKFALYTSGKDAPDDVYDAMSSFIFQNKLTREAAKLITLCVLYGQSKRNLAKKLPIGMSANQVCRQTSRYFGYESLVNKIKSNIKDGFMNNHFGRPIKVDNCGDNVLVNYFLQSSVAEASLLMFSDFCKKYSDCVTPLYVIHDALIVDAEEVFFEKINNSNNVDLFLGEWKFKSQIKILSDNYST